MLAFFFESNLPGKILIKNLLFPIYFILLVLLNLLGGGTGKRVTYYVSSSGSSLNVHSFENGYDCCLVVTKVSLNLFDSILIEISPYV